MRLLLLLLAGCAEQFALPMTAAQLASQPSGAALVAYLGQPDATPAVCDLQTRGPHALLIDDKALVAGLVDGKIAPELWRRCAQALVKSAPPALSSSWVDAVGQGYRRLIRRSDFESRPELQARLFAMQRFYIDRKNGRDGHAAVDDKLMAELRQALVQRRLGPAATEFGEELVEIVEVEHGRWLGQPIDAALIDQLYAHNDEKTLLRFGRRLPSAPLRDEARRRVVRLHIASSPFPEVRAQAAAVEERVMQKGNNPLSLGEHPALDGSLHDMPMRGVLVRQQIWQQTATLLGYGGTSVLPEVKLRGVLLVSVSGVSQPVTLCAPKKQLDPSPCLDVHDVRLENPAAYLDADGAFHFVEHIQLRDAVHLAQKRERFVLPVSVGGKLVASFDWRLYYERPEDLLFTGSEPGADGPQLEVSVDRRDPERFIFRVGDYFAVVERADAAAFRVGSQGAAGVSGGAGSSGSSGSSGGECENGGNGGDGGPGGDGGDGGNGGEVWVQVVGGEADALVRDMVVSLGGAGGPGGPGGAGGAGGSGGSGRSPTTHTDENGNTVTDDAGCSAGSSGSSGSSGSDGSSGAPGRPGRVSFR